MWLFHTNGSSSSSSDAWRVRSGRRGDCVMKMNVRPIKTEADYGWALKEIARYFDVQPKPGTTEGARFDVLATLIEAYEDKHWPIDPPDPVDAIQYRMEQAGLGQAATRKAAEVTREIRRWLVENKPCTFFACDLISMDWLAGRKVGSKLTK